MIYQKTVSIMLCLTLIGGSIPLNAQPIPRKKEVPSYNQTGVYSFGGFNSGFTAPSFGNTGNVLMAPPQKAKSPSPLNFLHPYQGLNYFEAISLYKKLNPNGNLSGFHDVYYIKPAWNKYQSAIKDYHNSEFANYTPYEVMNAMSRETKVISELLKKNPRYQKELKKAKVKEYGSACLQGIVLGLLTVAAVYTAGATLGAEGALVATWFGSSAAVTSMTLASASITKGLAAVIMLEMMTFLGSEIVDNLYEDLTQRLVKYNYLTNSQYAQDLTGSAAKASGDSGLSPLCPQAGTRRLPASQQSTANRQAAGSVRRLVVTRFRKRLFLIVRRLFLLGLQVEADVVAVVLAVEVQFVGSLEALFQRLLLVFPVGTDGNDAPSAGDCPAVLDGCPGMEQHAARGFGLVEPADGHPFLVCARITSADQHDAGCRPGVGLHVACVEVALVHAFKEVYQVALQPQHDAFCLRVAHADIVFDDERLSLYVH